MQLEFNSSNFQDKNPVFVSGSTVSALLTTYEFARRGIPVQLLFEEVLLIEDPRQTLLFSSTMEYLESIGLGDAVRAKGLSKLIDQKIFFGTSVIGDRSYEFHNVSYAEAKITKQKSLYNSEYTHAFPHRIPQFELKRILLDIIKEIEGVELIQGKTFETFDEHEGYVSIYLKDDNNGEIEKLNSKFLVGADGELSSVRRKMNIKFEGRKNLEIFSVITFNCGQLKSDVDRFVHGYIVNESVCGIIELIDNGSNMWQILIPDRYNDTTKDPVTTISQIIGKDYSIENVKEFHYNSHAIDAVQYSSSNVFLLGDAIHMFPHSHNTGLNAAIEDVRNITWKLAAYYEGWGSRKLLDSYHQERKERVTFLMKKATEFSEEVFEILKPTKNKVKGKLSSIFGSFTKKYLNSVFKNCLDSDMLQFKWVMNSPVNMNVNRNGFSAGDDSFLTQLTIGARPPFVVLSDNTTTISRLDSLVYTIVKTDAFVDIAPLEAAFKKKNVPYKIEEIVDSELSDIYTDPIIIFRPDGILGWLLKESINESTSDELVDTLIGH